MPAQALAAAAELAYNLSYGKTHRRALSNYISAPSGGQVEN